MCGVSDQSNSTLSVIPWLSDPVAYICFVDLSIVRNPSECRSSGLSQSVGFLADQVHSFLVRFRGFLVGEPCHRHMENPRLGMIDTIWHTGDCRNI